MTNILGYLIIFLGWIIFGTYLVYEYLAQGTGFLDPLLYPKNMYEFIFMLQIAAIPLIFTIIGIIINGRLKLLESLKRTELKYRDLFENAPIGYHSLAPDTTVLEVNNTWLKMFGYRREDIVGKVKLLNLISDKYKDSFLSAFMSLKEKARVENIAYEIKKNDGTELPVIINTMAFYDEQGKYLHNLTAVKDNSVQVAYENVLKESAREWRATYDNMPNGALILDKNVVVRKINKYLIDILGISYEDAIGKKYYEIMYNSLEYPSDCPVREVKEKLLPVNREMYHKKLNRFFLINITPIFDEKGLLHSFIQTMIDITDIKDRETKLKESRTAFYNMLKDVDFAYKDLKELHDGLIFALAKAVDAKSPWTKNHSEFVARYSVMIGKQLGLNAKELETLRVSAILHDIGKIGIYDSILYKPGSLTSDEYSLVKMHSERGSEIVSHIRQLEDIARIIKYHHERFDGNGYPEGLKDGQIPFYSRIIAVADAYEAMTSDRPYRPVLFAEMAIEELNRCANTQFDPDLVKVFIKTIT